MFTQPQTTIQFHPDGTLPRGDAVWVFGSNVSGRHGKGAARVARVNFRAEYGVGNGPTGNAYAIPTKDRHLQTLPLRQVVASIQEFLAWARANPKLSIFVTRVGCVLAGFTDEEIGPHFAAAPPNCSLPDAWKGFVQQYRLQHAEGSESHGGGLLDLHDDHSGRAAAVREIGNGI
jgi:hypothetical protein